MAANVYVQTPLTEYQIYIKNSYDELAFAIQTTNLCGYTAVIITDEIVDRLYTFSIRELLLRIFTNVYAAVIPAGETNKNHETLIALYHKLQEFHADRQTVIFALGGGVVGDVAGFCASTYMRGIPYVQLPTTLLACVDSSVGGKTGVDLGNSKNIIGAFYQPQFVYINTSAIQSLPPEQFSAGMGEVIKTALIRDAELYEYIRDNREAIRNREETPLSTVIARTCRIKAKIVTADEKETGVRAILNFGHTFGHSLESLSGFGISHGHSVMHGCRAAMYLSKLLGYDIKDHYLSDLTELLEFFGLSRLSSEYPPDLLYDKMFEDKKTKNGELNFVLITDIGFAQIYKNPTKKAVFDAIQYMMDYR
ncbi:3-dehydroquinate synthase [Clostridia bacterium]|nr:3-dehydroquinate synthase [Clostridia bacterium]